MKPHGKYKLRYRQARFAPCEADLRSEPLEAVAAADGLLARLARSEQRIERILTSLRDQIVEGGGGSSLRIRRVFKSPREVYRLELELPELGYLRTTFLDREALEELLEEDDVREVVETAVLGG
jgi:hypothetical protein